MIWLLSVHYFGLAMAALLAVRTLGSITDHSQSQTHFYLPKITVNTTTANPAVISYFLQHLGRFNNNTFLVCLKDYGVLMVIGPQSYP